VKYSLLKGKDAARNARNNQVAQIRRGNLQALAPDLFPEGLPAAVTANIIDISARDMGEILGRLPKVRCRATGSSGRAANQATIKTKIAQSYIEVSGLQRHMFAACDRLVSFGTLPLVVDPDFDIESPVIRIASSRNSFYEKNLRGDVVHFFEWWNEPRRQLEAKFPGVPLARNTVGGAAHDSRDTEELLTVVKYYGPDELVMFIPERENMVLMRAPNPIGRTPVRVVELPEWDEELHGNFDNAIWVQIARARMAQMVMELMDDSLHAPLAVPPDVTKLALGANAIIRTQNPQNIRRVDISVPREAFVQGQSLEREERIAARYPEGRSGNIDASVITGQGVQALLGTIDSQVQTLQTLTAFEFERTIQMAFQMDEALWPDVKKTIEGHIRGKRYKETYTPAKDIRGDYSVEVSYGMMQGLDPNRAAVMQLQYLGAGLVDKSTVRDEMPFDIDVDDIEERLDREAIEDALRAGVQAMLGNLSTMVQAGQDPSDLLAKAASLVEKRENGTPLTKAILETFKPKPEQQAQQDPFQQAAAELGGGGMPAEQGPPDLMQMISGLTAGGNPSMSARTLRQMPAA
jgi:hypothetical protein